MYHAPFAAVFAFGDLPMCDLLHFFLLEAMTSPSLSLHLFKAKLTLHLAFLKLLLLAVASPSWVSHVPQTLLGASSLLSQQLWPVRNFCGCSWWSFVSGVSLVSLDVRGGGGGGSS